MISRANYIGQQRFVDRGIVAKNREECTNYTPAILHSNGKSPFLIGKLCAQMVDYPLLYQKVDRVLGDSLLGVSKAAWFPIIATPKAPSFIDRSKTGHATA